MKSIHHLFFIICVFSTSFIQSDNVVVSSSLPIVTNQLGYRPTDNKIAFLKDYGGKTFFILDKFTGKKMFEGKVNPIGVKDVNTGDVVFSIEFSRFANEGTFKIMLDDSTHQSHYFKIQENVYDIAARKSLESFYFQRCGIPVGTGTVWFHPPCHTNAAKYFDHPDNLKDVSGGWHDAGDYNKFVPTTAVSVAFLLYLYELQPEKFNDGQLQIPERENGVPDILDEVRWGLEWLLKMQEETGGVAHKVSIKKWTSENLPHEESDTQYIFAPSSAATASFAAVTALGARIFGKYDKAFARTLLQASLKAWKFLVQHPAVVPLGGFKNPSGVEGGEYDDIRDADERLWASVELFKTTGTESFHDYFLTHYQELGGINYTVSWQNVQNFAYNSYVNLPTNARNYPVRSFIISTMTTYCDALINRISANGYRYVLMPEQYYWGSNSVAMGYAYDLILAYETTKHEKYLKGALDQLHYMLGRNTFGISFVTGVGTHSVQHPYHQFSMLLRQELPVPGMLVAGSNSFSTLNGKQLSSYPGACYEDNEKNYFVNEPAINYTAPFVFVTGYFSKLQTAISAKKSNNQGG